MSDLHCFVELYYLRLKFLVPLEILIFDRRRNELLHDLVLLWRVVCVGE